jgi:hypothetical protein
MRTIRLGIHADAQVVKREDCAAILQGIEAGLKESARGYEDAAVADLAEGVRLKKAERHSREVRDDGIWYDLAAIENHLVEIDEVKTVKFSFDARRNGSLTARAVVSDGASIKPSDLQAVLLEHVGVGTLAAIPDCYELTDGTDSAEHDIDKF